MLSWLSSNISQKEKVECFSARLMGGIDLLCSQVTARGDGREGTRLSTGKQGKAVGRTALSWQHAVGSDQL